MPVRRRVAKIKRQDLMELTDDQQSHLTNGYTYFDGGFTDEETFRAAWEIHGAKLLAEWIKDHPGTRPLAWWICDHRRERPIVNPFANQDQIAEWRKGWRANHWGFLHTSAIGMGPNGWGPFQEPEADYLDRHDMLTPEEVEKLEAEDAE